MTGFFSSLFSRRKKIEQGAFAGLDRIKARYHIFRVILAHAGRAFAAMAEADRLLHENEAGTLSIVLEELCETALELADGLNRLTGNGHLEFYPRLESARARLWEVLEQYSRAPRGVWIPLAQVTPDMREQAGGKAQPLSSLIRAGVAVPDGFVIPRRSCRSYLRQARLEERLGAILHDAAIVGADLEALSKRARTMILASEPTPEFTHELQSAWESLAQNAPLSVSVRSSASGEDGREHSFAGQYSSVLGVNSPSALLAAFKEVLASAFSPRAMTYRLNAGLGRQSVDMAVLCQRMVDARTAGVLFTKDPTGETGETGRMLLTAVPGLGELAVSGRAPADTYHPSRSIEGDAAGQVPCEIAVKTQKVVPDEAGGVRLTAVGEAEARQPLLTFREVEALRLTALRIEALAGCVQDIEWSIDKNGALWILQSRPAHLAKTKPYGCESEGTILSDGGVGVSPGKAAGVAVLIRSALDMAQAARMEEPVVLVLRQSLLDGVSLPPNLAGIVMDMGGPLDQMASLARENWAPMVTGLGSATAVFTPGQWVLVDGDRGVVFEADARLWKDAPKPLPLAIGACAARAAEAIRSLVLDAGPTGDSMPAGGSVAERGSLRGITNAIYEQAVNAIFMAGDAIAGETIPSARRVQDDSGMALLLIDIGGGLVPGESPVIPREAIRCEPLTALLAGMQREAAPVSGMDGAGHALATRDSFTLHVRTGSHAVMVDAAYGAGSRENSVRVRFKGERLAASVEETLRDEGFSVSRQGELVLADIMEGSRELVRQKIEMVGRFLRREWAF